MSSNSIDLAQLSVEQLAQIKTQLDEEVQHLTQSFATLQAASARYRRGKECVDSLATFGDEKAILVPLTSSLYVPGKLKNTENVIVDVGTGYFVKKNTKEAKTFYNTKVLDLRKQTDNLQPLIDRKTEDRQVVGSLLQQRLSERERQKAREAKAGGGAT